MASSTLVSASRSSGLRSQVLCLSGLESLVLIYVLVVLVMICMVSVALVVVLVVLVMVCIPSGILRPGGLSGPEYLVSMVSPPSHSMY